MRTSSKLAKVLTILLGLVLVVFITAEVAHSHPAGKDDVTAAATCQLCSIAHVGTVTQPAWLTAHVLQLIAIVAIGEPLPSFCSIVRTSFIRPPPPVQPALS